MSSIEKSKPADLPTPKSTSSFWHKDPSPLLLGHRSTRHLPESADVVIIGSGITGASAAHHLLNSDANLSVVMLEAREACWGATGRNGGHCQPILFEHPNNPSIGSFELNNFHTLKNLIESNSIDCEFHVQEGVRAIYSQHHLDHFSAAIDQVRSLAPEQAEMMRLVTDEKELRALKLPTAIGAVVTCIAARMWPYKFVSRILSDLLTQPRQSSSGSFNLQTLTPVTSISHNTVHTARGNIKASRILLATNAYTSHLLPSFADLIVPCRGQMSALIPPHSLLSDRLQNSYGFIGDGIDDYLIQRPSESGGHLMFGGGRQHAPSMGVTDDNEIDKDTAAYLRGRLPEALGLSDAGKELKATHQWTGIMGYSRDDLPWVGEVPGEAGVFVAAGYTGHGMPNTWLCGKAAAMMAIGEGVENVVKETGLPREYLVSEERIKKARKGETVQEKDWAEMARGRV